MSEAQATERRWNRVLANERAMRLELQENLEALIKQMHGLESEARKATHQPSPQSSITSSSAASSAAIEERGQGTRERGRAEEEPDSAVEPVSEESEEEEFYDATEASAEEVTKHE